MSIRIVASAFVILLALAGCRQNPVYVPQGMTLTAPIADLSAVRTGIERAGKVSKWEIEFTGETSAIARRNFKNKHFAEMDLTFDGAGFSLVHRSARNFNYDGKYAHPTYNRFVKDLEDAIGYEYRQLSK